ncbi:putative serine protease K12H4.7, partial [Nilaparvata lugens]|uniref:putative serine protease K12H4.7 n=1 Tax=Nilaparvata lugens TaxID=108931 RepID=UPI00193D062B
DLSTENLKYLSSRQAIEDIVYFTDEMKKKFGMKCNNEVVLFGGSYPGALAAWARNKYPHKFSVAHASGAPIQAIFDFSGFSNVVRKSIELYDENCVSVIEQGAKKQQELMQTQDGLKNLTTKFKTCRPLEKDDLNKQAFFQKQISMISTVAQYNGTGTQDIPAMCKLLTEGYSDEDEPIDKLAKYVITTTKLTQNESCTGYNYHSNIKYLKETDWKEGGTSRQFLWQECTEFAWFLISNQNSSLFANTLGTDFYIKQCADVFGDKCHLNLKRRIDIHTKFLIEQEIESTNSYYGGRHNYNQSKCLFTQGQLDPWQAAGITEDNDKKGYKALIMKNLGHVRDQEAESDSDPPELVEAREDIKKVLRGWIEAFNFGQNPNTIPPIDCGD